MAKLNNVGMNGLMIYQPMESIVFILITSMWVYPEGTPNFVQVYIEMLRAKGMREPKRSGKFRTLLIFFFGISANAT